MVRTLLLFLLSAIAVTLYAEYIISRPVNIVIEVTATILLIAILVVFIRDLVKLIIKLLKL